VEREVCSLKTSLRGKAMHTITEHCWALLKWNCTTKHQVYQCLGAKLNTEVFVPACSAISSSIAYFHTISMSCRSIVAAVNYRGKTPLAHGLPARCRAGLAPLTPTNHKKKKKQPPRTTKLTVPNLSSCWKHYKAKHTLNLSDSLHRSLTQT